MAYISNFWDDHKFVEHRGVLIDCFTGHSLQVAYILVQYPLRGVSRMVTNPSNIAFLSVLTKLFFRPCRGPKSDSNERYLLTKHDLVITHDT